MKTSLNECWKLWRECLSSEDSNAIFSQISSMIWDAAIFRLVLESRKIQLKKHGDLPGLNVRFHMFIDSNFFESQAASIRRLIDSYGLHGERGVYSLRALVKDIAGQRENLTRETFLDLQGLPYEYSSASNHPDEFIWIDIKEAHERFDKLSGKSPTTRTHTDLISEKVYNKLEEILDSCSQIALYVDKHIAHAATPESRQVDLANEINITFGQIWIAHQSLFKVAAFLSGSLFAQDFSPLPLEASDMFEIANIPVIETNHISNFEKVWKEYRDETEEWRLNQAEKLWNVIENETRI